MTAELHGYEYSVYAWIARFALHEKRVSYEWVEVNPFADDLSADYLALHPFGRVPTLVDGDFTLFETSAITRYIDEAFDGPGLQPSALRARARVNQIISIVDSYVYWPLVRQVFSHGVMGPRIGRPSDPSAYQQGLAAAPRILRALDGLVSDGSFLVGDTLTLADIHMAPMMSYFTAANDGFDLLERHTSLLAWVDDGILSSSLCRYGADIARASGVMRFAPTPGPRTKCSALPPLDGAPSGQQC